MHETFGDCQGPPSGSMTERLLVVAFSIELFEVELEVQEIGHNGVMHEHSDSQKIEVRK